jgi:hypothetical protein
MTVLAVLLCIVAGITTLSVVTLIIGGKNIGAAFINTLCIVVEILSAFALLRH